MNKEHEIKQHLLIVDVMNLRDEANHCSFITSIGEISSAYKAGKLVINDSFKKDLFKQDRISNNKLWDELEKSKLIESILLGEPIPLCEISINKHGVWEVLEGALIIKTILSFMGLLKNDMNSVGLNNKIVINEPYIFKYAKGLVWDESMIGENNDLYPMPYALKVLFKKERIRLNVIKRYLTTN